MLLCSPLRHHGPSCQEPKSRGADSEFRRGDASLSLLYDHEVSAFDLAHDAREDLVDDGIEGGIISQIMGNVDLEALMR